VYASVHFMYDRSGMVSSNMLKSKHCPCGLPIANSPACLKNGKYGLGPGFPGTPLPPSLSGIEKAAQIEDAVKTVFWRWEIVAYLPKMVSQPNLVDASSKSLGVAEKQALVFVH
jgi:hypothetical protein